MLKELSTALTVIGIVMTLFHKKYPSVGAWGVPIGLIGLLGVYYLS